MRIITSLAKKQAHDASEYLAPLAEVLSDRFLIQREPLPFHLLQQRPGVVRSVPLDVRLEHGQIGSGVGPHPLVDHLQQVLVDFREPAVPGETLDEDGVGVGVGGDAGGKHAVEGAEGVLGVAAGAGIGLDDGCMGDDVGHGALVLDDGEELEGLMGEAILGQGVEHLDGVVGEALGAHLVEDFLEVGRVAGLLDHRLLAERVVGRGKIAALNFDLRLLLRLGGGGAVVAVIPVIGPVEGGGGVGQAGAGEAAGGEGERRSGLGGRARDWSVEVGVVRF